MPIASDMASSRCSCRARTSPLRFGERHGSVDADHAEHEERVPDRWRHQRFHGSSLSCSTSSSTSSASKIRPFVVAWAVSGSVRTAIRGGATLALGPDSGEIGRERRGARQRRPHRLEQHCLRPIEKRRVECRRGRRATLKEALEWRFAWTSWSRCRCRIEVGSGRDAPERFILRHANETDRPERCCRWWRRRAWREGTTHVVFEPLDLIARLAALVPKPRVNLTRFHGVFAPNSRHRAFTPSGCA